MTGTDVARFTHKSFPVIFEPPFTYTGKGLLLIRHAGADGDTRSTQRLGRYIPVKKTRYPLYGDTR